MPQISPLSWMFIPFFFFFVFVLMVVGVWWMVIKFYFGGSFFSLSEVGSNKGSFLDSVVWSW